MNSKSSSPNCFGGEPEKSPCTHRAKRLGAASVSFSHLFACWPARYRQSSMNFSTSLGSNRSGLLPGPIFTAGRYGLRFPDACCITQEMLTPSFFATSPAFTNCRMGRTSAIAPATLPWNSTPLTRGIRCSFKTAVDMILIYGTDERGVKTQTHCIIRMEIRGTVQGRSSSVIGTANAYLDAF